MALNPPAQPDQRYEIAYTEAQRLLAAQHQTLEDLRTRSTTVLSAAAVAVSFLGGLGVLGSKDVKPLQVWAIIALVLILAVIGGLVIAILWPIQWTHGLSAGTVVGQYIEGPQAQDLNRMRRNLALWLDKRRADNETKLTQRATMFRVASGLLLA